MRRVANQATDRYVGSQFDRAQLVTLPFRRALVPVLGLREGDEKWFEMPVKENLSTFAHMEEVQAVQNLWIVHYIEIKGENPPPEVLASVRGTIVYHNQGKYSIIRKSIPYTQDIVLDVLTEVDGKYALQVPVSGGSRSIKVSPSSLKIVPYMEGTVIDIMKIDGVTQWFTSHNVLPKGVRDSTGRNVYKKSRWGHHEAFTDDFESIIRTCDPKLLNSRDELFPKNCKTSNKLYRFILLTRERVRAEASPISERGVLVYIGCLTQFQYSDYPEMDFGEKHDVEYVPRSEKSIPADRPAIVQFPEMSIEQANNWLAGAHPELGLLSGGGKLVVTARVVGAGVTETHIFHIKSHAYEYRESILGNSPDLYKQFLTLLDLHLYDFTSKSGSDQYYHDFPSVVLPNTADEVAALRDTILAEAEIVPVSAAERALVPSTPVTHIWYIFMLCVNVSIRERVLRYLERYARDLIFLQQWMFTLKAAEPFKATARGTDSAAVRKAQNKAQRDRDFILTLRTEILRHELYNRKDANTVMLVLGNKTSQAIGIARRVTGTSMDSIAISEPELREGSAESLTSTESVRTDLSSSGPITQDADTETSSTGSMTIEEERRLVSWD
ncbi:Hypothetical protein POVR2_LOCUS217 [uncultured virus]|nr:Hypothetical protein POVR2_LOCUS217 [uncultured virus]